MVIIKTISVATKDTDHKDHVLFIQLKLKSTLNLINIGQLSEMQH